MSAARRKPSPAGSAPGESRKPRTDPRRLKAFATRLNLMLGEMGLPERGRAKVIKERIGVSGTTAANWLRGQSYPSFEELTRMGRLGLDPGRLLPDGAEIARTTAHTTVPEASTSARLARLLEQNEVAPLPQLQGDDGNWNHTALPNSVWQHLQGRGPAGLVLLLMKGDAMGDRIRDGTPLIVDTTITQITDDNGIYVLLVGESLMVRRVQRRLQGGYVIACDNAAIANETVDRLGSHQDEAAADREVLVLGRVTAAIQKL
jgi:phage repressor protein C with HTH and peptisase S24 domain